MQKALKHLSKEELIALFKKRDNVLLQELKSKDEKIDKAQLRISELEFQLAQYKRIVHGQKRERFEGNKNQMSLPFEADPEQVQKQEEEVKENFPLNAEKENLHIKVECHFLITCQWKKSRFILRKILPIWYVSARKLLRNSNTSQLNITSNGTFVINMLQKTKRAYLLENFPIVLSKKESQELDSSPISWSISIWITFRFIDNFNVLNEKKYLLHLPPWKGGQDKV